MQWAVCSKRIDTSFALITLCMVCCSKVLNRGVKILKSSPSGNFCASWSQLFLRQASLQNKSNTCEHTHIATDLLQITSGLLFCFLQLASEKVTHNKQSCSTVCWSMVCTLKVDMCTYTQHMHYYNFCCFACLSCICAFSCKATLYIVLKCAP